MIYMHNRPCRKALTLYKIEELQSDRKGCKKIISEKQWLVNRLLFMIKYQTTQSSQEQLSRDEKEKT